MCEFGAVRYRVAHSLRNYKHGLFIICSGLENQSRTHTTASISPSLSPTSARHKAPSVFTWVAPPPPDLGASRLILDFLFVSGYSSLVISARTQQTRFLVLLMDSSLSLRTLSLSLLGSIYRDFRRSPPVVQKRESAMFFQSATTSMMLEMGEGEGGKWGHLASWISHLRNLAPIFSLVVP